MQSVQQAIYLKATEATSASRPPPRWQFWIDRGGTFTDIVGKRPDGTLVTHKLLSDNPEQYGDAAVAGIRHLLGLTAGQPVTANSVECVKMGTTVATNALLERKGEPTLLVTTRGFRDALRIAYQNRPRLFDRHIVLPELLYCAVVEAQERMGAHGEVVQALDESLLKRELEAQYQKGLKSVSIVFMHGYRYPAHEQAAKRLAQALGFTQISVSHEVSPMMKLVSRGDTTVVDAYLSPILKRYVAQVAADMPGVKLLFMQSSGGLTDAHAFGGKDAILSGPAGGIVGMARTAELAFGTRRVAPTPAVLSQKESENDERGLLAPTALTLEQGEPPSHANLHGLATTANDETIQGASPHPSLPPAGEGANSDSRIIRQADTGDFSLPRWGRAGVGAGCPAPLFQVTLDGSAFDGPVRVIGFDMGGTSTDVSHYAGEFEREFETQVAGVRMRAPMMSIHTVAAGGGSILAFDGARLRVGPKSAGANPGPASYRRGGPLAVTDANVMVGKVQPRYFPKVFGPAANEALDADVVRLRFAELARQVAMGGNAPPADGSKGAHAGDSPDALGMTPEALAEGFISIAVQQMANAIKKISVARGYDVTCYTLQCFGGAGGQHACLVADALGMTRVLIHPLAGVLSAYGMGLADQTLMREQAVELPLTAQTVEALAEKINTLAENASTELIGQQSHQRRQEGQVRRATQDAQTAHDPDDAATPVLLPLPLGEGWGEGAPTQAPIQTLRRVHVRYAGSDAALVVPFGSLADITANFEAAYKQRFAFLMQGKPLVAEAISVEAVLAGDAPVEPRHLVHPPRDLQAAGLVLETARLYSGGQWHSAQLVQRHDLQAGDQLQGPAIIAEHNATTVVEPGWQADVTCFNHLALTRIAQRATKYAAGTNADPVLLEVFNNLFMNIAEQMGQQLQNTAYSVNIKERLDFSCALFDAAGNLIANAPHMPVHLGSMGESIKTVIAENAGRMLPGDVYVLNDPYHGGTHLPDVTVITPVYLDAALPSPQPSPAGGQGSLHLQNSVSADSPALPLGEGWGDGGPDRRPWFYVGSRGHHADIGGISPGSMPPFSTRIDEEGVQIHNVKLVDRGTLQEAELLTLLQSGSYPSRNPAQNLADLKAQIAANEKGVQELRKMVDQFGLAVVQAYMRHVQDNAEEAVRRVITRLKDGTFTLPLDNGAQINVAVRVDAATRSAEIDFTGTSAQQPNNFNAPTAVCMAAVLYVFRTLVNDDIPLNAGCLKPLKVIIPPGSMLNPNPPAAVVAGNVETSSCITNALYGALGVMAASQCTMNNFTFGNSEYQYYETVSGGSGAGDGFDGTSVVQTHMTNSRLTDPEVLEFRFPVRLESYAIRSGSGGDGQWCGGDGGVRRVRFLEPMSASILSNGRLHGAFGMVGGSAGQCGINQVQRADGSVQPLGHIGQVEMASGDVFEVHTPGGGGYGSPAA